METVVLSFDLGGTSGYTRILVSGSSIELQASGQIKCGDEGIDRYLKKALTSDNLPQFIAIEAPVHGTRRRKDGEYVGYQSDSVIACRAVIKHHCREHEIEFREFHPGTVKKAVTGNGRASKEQVRQMAQKLLNVEFKKDPKHHISDAAGVGITMANRLHLEGK